MSRLSRILAFLWTLSFSIAAIAQNPAKPRIDFVYFSSPDCSFCRAWEAYDLPKIKESPLFQHIRFTKVSKEIFSPVPPEFWFPDEIKDLREPIAEKIKGGGSPMFAILSNKQMVAGWRGTKRSPEQILRIIKKLQTPPASGSIAEPEIQPDAMR